MENEKNPKEKEKKLKRSSKSVNKEKRNNIKNDKIKSDRKEKTNKEKNSKRNSRAKSADIFKQVQKNKKSRKSSSSNNKKRRNKKNIKTKEDKPKKEEEIQEDTFFQSGDLYSLLGLQRSATNAQIRKAYKHLVLLCHPDKNKTDPNTSSKFINITKAYKILSNEESRKLYDETGEYDEESQGKINIVDTLNFFRKIYSPHDIETYEHKYRGSKEEEQDLITFYKENKGNMKKILECIPCSKNEDIERFLLIYNKLFEKKILTKNKMFEMTKNKIQKLKEEQDEKDEAIEIMDKLTRQIVNNNKKRNYNDYLEGLANKYRDRNDDGSENNDISEEEFQKIAKRLKRKKIKNKK